MNLHLSIFISLFTLCLIGCSPKIKSSLTETTAFLLITKVENTYEITTKLVCKTDGKHFSHDNNTSESTFHVPKIVIGPDVFGEIGVSEDEPENRYQSEVFLNGMMIGTSLGGNGIHLKIKINPSNDPKIVRVIGVLSANNTNKHSDYLVIPFHIDCILNQEKKIFYKSHLFNSSKNDHK